MTLQLLAATFRHGVHPHEFKERTEHLALQRMPFVERYVLPLSQHIGAPCRAVVDAGDKVKRGQVIAEPGGFVSPTLHSPVTGKVVGVGPRRHPNGHMAAAIEIAADPYATQRAMERDPVDPDKLSAKDFVAKVQESGLVGMGGAAFPSHVKYATPAGKRIRKLVINGCECEPFLTCDHRMMVERPDAVVRGTHIVGSKLGVDDSTIGVELNKPDAIDKLLQVVRPEQKISVVGLRVKYPQGAEKMLIRALFGLKVPAGGLPLDLDIVVNNVGTMAGVADYFDRGLPFIERAVTVSGPGVKKPANLIVPIGTPVREVLRYCGGLTDDTEIVVNGGPMMGQPLASLDGPVLKGTSGLLAFTARDARLPVEYNCIRCGRCLEACPNFLNPTRFARLAKVQRWEEMEEYFVYDCMECGACSFACPSGIPIVQLIRTAKAALSDRKKAQG
jgi:electron transport complex protein RnfC